MHFTEKGSNTTSRQTSLDSRGRVSNPSDKEMGAGASPPMMKVIAQLWCHECTRTFADRLVSDEGMFEEISVVTVLTFYHAILTYNNPKEKVFRKHSGQRRKCW